MNPRDIYYGVGSNALGNILMLGATVWVTLVLTPAAFGEFRVGSAFAILLVPYIACGSERMISKLIQSDATDLNAVAEVISAVFGMMVISVVALAALYPLLNQVLFDGNVSLAVYASSIAIIPLTISYNLANTIWRHRGSAASAQVHLNLLQRALRAPLLIGVAYAWPSAVAASLAMLIAQAASLFQIRRNLLCYPITSLKHCFRALRANLGTLAVVGIPVALMASVDRLDVLLVNAVMGVADAGTYDLVFLLSATAMFPAMALSKSSEPFLYEIAKHADLRARLSKLQTQVFFISAAAVIGIAVVAPIFARILGNAGAGFAEATLILSAGLAFSSAHGPVIEYLQINGRARVALAIMAILLPVFFGLKYVVADAGSMVGVAALAGLFYFTFRLVLSLYVVIEDRIYLSRLWVALGSAIGYLATALYVWRF
ncbi:MAG: hypothetical protein QM621_07330 [Aeromicrobium sp.]|uniref:lipopolysaccharide biosynthesis protein n=1 Tax=Aeromicrobium sp. TaxID=1871063 RepID=UPI0039E3DDB6